jgi:hypothetical protein
MRGRREVDQVESGDRARSRAGTDPMTVRDGTNPIAVGFGLRPITEQSQRWDSGRTHPDDGTNPVFEIGPDDGTNPVFEIGAGDGTNPFFGREGLARFRAFPASLAFLCGMMANRLASGRVDLSRSGLAP